MCIDGAALFYASTQSLDSVKIFKEYLLHLSFTSVADDASSRVTSIFPFSKNAVISDRERIFIPLGWDCREKIATLGEDFDFSAISASSSSVERQKEVFASVIGKLDSVAMVRVCGNTILLALLQYSNLESRVESEEEQSFLANLLHTLPLPLTAAASMSTNISQPMELSKAVVDTTSEIEVKKKVIGANGEVGVGDDPGNEVLANFFQSLLKK